MFTPIIKNIEEKEYKLAVDALVPLLDEENERVVATAHYMLGYINTCSDYSERNDRQAKRHLRLNMGMYCMLKLKMILMLYSII